MIPGYITWNVDPVLFTAGPVMIRWYSVFLLVSFYLSYRFTVYIYLRENRPREDILSYGLFILAGLLLGGRLVHCLAYEPEYYLKYPWDIIKPWRGVLGQNARFVGYRGMSGHGSALGILLGIALNSLRTGTSMVWMADRIALFGPLIGFFVRLGNLFNSEILGTASGLPWAFLFVRTDSIPRHPVQLYEAVAYLAIFIFSFRYYLKRAGKEKKGEFLGLVLTLVYSARFFLEFFKDKQSDVESTMSLNVGHMLSIPLIIAGLILLFRPARQMNQKTAAALFLLCILHPGLRGGDPDTAFNNQFRKEIGGWIAADATYSIHLPDGRTLWLFGDTFIGEVDANNAILPGAKFIRNSAVLQQGDSLTTLFSGTRQDPGDFIPTLHPDSTWYWPEHGLVEGDSLRIFLAKFRHNPEGPPGFQFEHAGNDIGTFTYPGLDFIYATAVEASSANGVLYGDRILEDTTHLYIYGRKSDPEFNIPYPHAARAPLGRLMDQEWEFYDGSGWRPDPESTTRINNFQVSQQYSVSVYKGKYILLTQDIWLSPKIFTFTSKSPVGPWQNQRLIYTTPVFSPDIFTYNAYVHPQFDKNGEMLVSYNVNGDFWSIFSNVEIYRPRFVRIPYMNLDYDFWPTGLRENRTGSQIEATLYPNPVSGLAVIHLLLQAPDHVTMDLMDMSGKVLITEHYPDLAAGDHLIELPLMHLEPGTYLLRIVSHRASLVLKMIKTTN